MENVIIQSTKKVLKEKISTFENAQKTRIINACNSSMKYAEVLKFIEGEIEQSKKQTNFRYALKCWKADGAYQFNRAIQEIFGTANAKTDGTPSGDSSIETIDVIFADGSRTKVPYGEIALPDLGENSSITINYDTARNNLVITGTCQFKYQSLIDDIVDRTKELLSTSSIYKNQALEITDINNPQILSLDGIDKQLMVLSKKTEFELQPLKSRILYPEKCRQRGIPLKTGVLLEGKYGTGKFCRL